MWIYLDDAKLLLKICTKHISIGNRFSIIFTIPILFLKLNERNPELQTPLQLDREKFHNTCDGLRGMLGLTDVPADK